MAERDVVKVEKVFKTLFELREDKIIARPIIEEISLELNEASSLASRLFRMIQDGAKNSFGRQRRDSSNSNAKVEVPVSSNIETSVNLQVHSFNSEMLNLSEDIDNSKSMDVGSSVEEETREEVEDRHIEVVPQPVENIPTPPSEYGFPKYIEKALSEYKTGQVKLNKKGAVLMTIERQPIGRIQKVGGKYRLFNKQGRSISLEKLSFGPGVINLGEILDKMDQNINIY